MYIISSKFIKLVLPTRADESREDVKIFIVTKFDPERVKHLCKQPACDTIFILSLHMV